MNLPTLIVEYGQQRQRLTLKKFHFIVRELVKLFAELFQTSFDLAKYEILLSNRPLDPSTELNFAQMEKYPRFRIRLCNPLLTACSSNDQISLLKQRLNTASAEVMEVTFLINSIHTNCQNLIRTLLDEDHCSNKLSTKSADGKVPPGFQPRSINLPVSARDSQSTDEGIDSGSVSIFESAHGDNDEFESTYHECREDATLINQPTPIFNKDNSQLAWRNQPPRSRPHWNNNNKMKYPSNYPKDQWGEKPHLQKLMNLNKTPLPPEKKKNIPCKYAAGGNCKRGNQCRFIHVV